MPVCARTPLFCCNNAFPLTRGFPALGIAQRLVARIVWLLSCFFKTLPSLHREYAASCGRCRRRGMPPWRPCFVRLVDLCRRVVGLMRYFCWALRVETITLRVHRPMLVLVCTWRVEILGPLHVMMLLHNLLKTIFVSLAALWMVLPVFDF